MTTVNHQRNTDPGLSGCSKAGDDHTEHEQVWGTLSSPWKMGENQQKDRATPLRPGSVLHVGVRRCPRDEERTTPLHGFTETEWFLGTWGILGTWGPAWLGNLGDPSFRSWEQQTKESGPFPARWRWRRGNKTVSIHLDSSELPMKEAWKVFVQCWSLKYLSSPHNLVPLVPLATRERDRGDWSRQGKTCARLSLRSGRRMKKV